MKKILLFLALVSVLCCTACTSAQEAQPISFNGKTYTLKFSQKNPQTGAYINEYYLPEQKYDNWTELVGVYNYPSFSSPIEYASKLQANLEAKNLPSDMYENTDENMAIVSFMAGGGPNPTKVELNTFIFESSDNGVIAFQYAKRYFLNTEEDTESMTKDVLNTKMEIVKLMTEVTIPELIKKDIDLGK